MIDKSSIVEEIKNGVIRIDPFDEKYLGPNSYDLSIGGNIIRYANSTFPLWIDSENSILNAFDYPEQHREYFLIRSKERLLAHTIEYAGAYKRYVPKLASRSSTARWGLDICASAGFGDVGYVNRWTLEVYNFTNYHIFVPVGARLCQIYFDRLVDHEGNHIDGEDTYAGIYQQEKEWEPRDMLPKLIKAND